MKFNFVKLLLVGGVTNTSNNNFDRSAVNNSYLDVYRNIFLRENFNMNNFNDFLGKYYLLRSDSGYSGNKAIKHTGVGEYQLNFNDYGFHTPEFAQGWIHTNKPLADSGDNFDTGTWNKADDYFGAITNERTANLFNPEELAAQNNLARQYGLLWVEDERASGITPTNGRKFYRLDKLTDGLQQPQQEELQEELQEEVKQQNVTNENISLNPPEKLPWTDWIPITALAGNSWLAAVRLANLLKQLKFPLQEAPFLLHKITNNYHLRTGMQQNADELRDLAAFRSNSSDLRLNLDNMSKYDTQASQIENQAEQEKANKFAQETQISENVANANMLTGVEVANRNAQANVAAWNNIINANQQLEALKAAISNDWIDKIATSYGLNVLDNRLNQLAYQRGLIDYNASLAQLNAYNNYLNTTDYKNSLAYKAMLADIETAGQAAGGSGREIPGLDFSKRNDETTWQEELSRFWRSDSDYAKRYYKQWEKEVEEAEKNLYNLYLLIGNKKAAYLAQLPYRINNLGYYKQNLFTAPTFAKGGSVRARFIDYQNHTQRDLHNSVKQSQKRSELRQKSLDKLLDRLSKEQLLLLRSIFK